MIGLLEKGVRMLEWRGVLFYLGRPLDRETFQPIQYVREYACEYVGNEYSKMSKG